MPEGEEELEMLERNSDVHHTNLPLSLAYRIETAVQIKKEFEAEKYTSSPLNSGNKQLIR